MKLYFVLQVNVTQICRQRTYKTEDMSTSD